MTEERPSRRSRRSRRRYFRTKKGGTAAQSQAQAPQTEERKATVKIRKTRRKSRSRQRVNEEARRQAMQELEAEYIAPESVFVYTFSVHSEMRDYEFRPEHFSRVGRRLEDYQIDLAKLFPEGELAEDGTPVMVTTMPKPEYDWNDWEEEG